MIGKSIKVVTCYLENSPLYHGVQKTLKEKRILTDNILSSYVTYGVFSKFQTSANYIYNSHVMHTL